MRRPRFTRRKWLALLAVAVLLVLAGAMGGIVWMQPRFVVRGLANLNPEVLFEVQTTRKIVALTIDDGPHEDNTPGVLDLLSERGVRVTFFILGDHIPGNEALLRRMKADGHELGNHLVEDRPSVTLPAEEFTRQLLVVDPWIAPEAEYRWMRPGSGWFTPDMIRRVASYGYGVCLGSIFPHDDVIHDPETLADDVLGRVYPGAIIILHDGDGERRNLVQTLERVLDGLDAQGFEVLTVSGLVAQGR